MRNAISFRTLGSKPISDFAEKTWRIGYDKSVFAAAVTPLSRPAGMFRFGVERAADRIAQGCKRKSTPDLFPTF